MKIVEMLKNFWHEEDGLEMVEWAMIGAFVAATIVVAWSTMKGTITSTMTGIEADINSAG